MTDFTYIINDDFMRITPNNPQALKEWNHHASMNDGCMNYPQQLENAILMDIKSKGWTIEKSPVREPSMQEIESILKELA